MRFDSVVMLRGSERAPEGFRIVYELERRYENTAAHGERVLVRTVALERIALVGTPRP